MEQKAADTGPVQSVAEVNFDLSGPVKCAAGGCEKQRVPGV